MGWQWHQLDHMQIICTRCRQITASTSSFCFYRLDALPVAQPAESKHWKQMPVDVILGKCFAVVYPVELAIVIPLVIFTSVCDRSIVFNIVTSGSVQCWWNCCSAYVMSVLSVTCIRMAEPVVKTVSAEWPLRHCSFSCHIYLSEITMGHPYYGHPVHVWWETIVILHCCYILEMIQDRNRIAVECY